MKKKILIAMLIVSSFSLAACSNGETSEESVSAQVTDSQSEEQSGASESQAEDTEDSESDDMNSEDASSDQAEDGNSESETSEASKGSEEAVEFVLNQERTILNFDAEGEQASEDQVREMLKMSMEAPSGLNQQPYWVTAIMDYDTQMELALTPEVRPQESTVLFIWSTPEGEDPSMADIGISFAYLQFLGQAYGFGSHIYMQPARMLQEEGNFTQYGIPEAYVPQAFALIGPSDTTDAETAATSYERKLNVNIFEPSSSNSAEESTEESLEESSEESSEE